MGGKWGVVLLFLSLISASAGGDRVDDAPERIVPAGEDVEFRCPAEGQGEIGEAAMLQHFLLLIRPLNTFGNTPRPICPLKILNLKDCFWYTSSQKPTMIYKRHIRRNLYNVFLLKKHSPSSIVWLKDGLPIPRGTVSRVDPSSSSSLLTLPSAVARDVGLYECLGGQEADAVLSSAYLFVDTGGEELIVPPRDRERIMKVASKEEALLPCRYTTRIKQSSLSWSKIAVKKVFFGIALLGLISAISHFPPFRPTLPGLNVSLVRRTTQRPVDLEAAGMSFDPRRGFTIREGKLRHHNGIFLCVAEDRVWNLPCEGTTAHPCCNLKSFESRMTIFLSYSFIQRAHAGALVLVSLHLP